MNYVCVLELNVSPKLDFMKQIVLFVDTTAVAISTDAFELQNFLHESSKVNKYFVPLFFNQSKKRKITQ